MEYTHEETNKKLTMTDYFERGGVQVRKRKRIVLLWWIFNVLAAVVVIAPLAAALSAFLGHSAAGQILPSSFDLHSLLEFVKSSSTLPRTGIVLFGVVFVLYSLFSLFLIGGSVALLQATPLPPGEDGKEDTRGMLGIFFQRGLRHWPRLLRLFLLSLLVYGLYFYAFGFLRRYLTSFVSGSIEELPVAYINWLKVGLLLFGLGCIKIFFDVVKIKMILEDNKSAIKATWGTLNMCSFRISKVFGMFLMTTLLSGGFGLLFRGILSLPAEKTLLSFFLIFCLHQLFLMLRITVRLWYYASTIAWYEDLVPACAVPTPPQLYPGIALAEGGYAFDDDEWASFEPTVDPKEAEATNATKEADMKGEG